jgi:uncharacterized protein
MKDISNQEVAAHIKRLNRWWNPELVKDTDLDKLTPRAYLKPVKDLMTDTALRRAVVLLGPRRVGKTILIRHLIRDLISNGHPATKIAYVELDHPLLRYQSLESLVQLCLEESGDKTAGIRYIFFDEVQYLKDWEQHLKPLVDHRPDLRILVSGSAAAALKRQSIESGAGRFTDFLLPPLTFPEYLLLRSTKPPITEVSDNSYQFSDINLLNEAFADYVNFGGYPELALSSSVRSDPARFVKSDIVDKVLLRDLPQLYGIQDIQELNSLFTILAYNTGGEITLEDLSKKIGVKKPTIAKYIDYLEAAFLLKRVFRVDQTGKRYQRERAFKIYLTNASMRTGLFGPLAPEDNGFGHIVETAIFAQRFHEDANLSYARWKNKDKDSEVDMIELDAALKPKFVMEIKWSDKPVDDLGEVSGLIKFCQENNLGHGWVSTRAKISKMKDENLVLNFWPSAAIAFHLGVRAIKGKIESFQASLNAGKS